MSWIRRDSRQASSTCIQERGENMQLDIDDLVEIYIVYSETKDGRRGALEVHMSPEEAEERAMHYRKLFARQVPVGVVSVAVPLLEATFGEETGDEIQSNSA